jgi:antitoxin ParD1/3/4
MAKNTSVSLGDYFDAFVKQEIQSGRYASVSEVIRSGLRLLEHEERKINDLRAALIKGEQSGWVEAFDSEAHLKALHAKHPLGKHE